MPEEGGRSAIGSLVPLLIGALLIPVALGSSATIFGDGDVSWHIATGEWILNHRTIPHTDPFSFTWAGKPWVPIEWLAELIEAAAFRLAHYSAVAALVTAALLVVHGLVYSNAVRSIRPWAAVVLVIAMDAVLIPMLLARPHVLAWALVALWTWVMLRARERRRAPPLAAALLMTVWANLHGSFVIGLAIAGAFGLDALVAEKDRKPVLREWVPFGLACAVAVLINPNGLSGVIHPLRMANLGMLPLIDEWKPSSLAVTPYFFGVLALVAVVLVVRRPRMPPVRALLIVGLLALALMQVRHQAVFAIVTAMLLPGPLGRTVAEPLNRRAAAMLAGAGALFVAIRAVLPMQLPYNGANPWPLIARVPPALRSQPVLNGYSMGGPLILSGIRPFVDGRGDMYGDAFIFNYKRISDGDPAAFAAAQKKWGFRWAILPAETTKLIALLDRTPGWRRAYGDAVGVIYVRDATSA